MPNSKSRTTAPIPDGIIERIYFIRGHNVMLDADLAHIYGVTTGALNQAVKRNPGRFPEDFIVPARPAGVRELRSHFVTSNPKAKMGLRRRPYAFTEQGCCNAF